MQSPVILKPERGRNVTAVLGPTNTGKTHLAIDRMLAHRSGLIGLPLRLLAREVYGRVVARLGADVAALITGEEKIIPAAARYFVATVEAMPLDLDAEFVAIDEVQLAADLERGSVFTDRILRVRGRFETLLLGALSARALLEKLIPGLNVITRPRMSVLTYTGEKKLTRLPPRSAVVTFSANDVYAVAELIRRQRGGAAIVMGALSPRTRNAQVELFQSGDVDFLIATDAIGMGLNLDVDHVAFASSRKFDGYQYRALTAGELGQIAGRAGRHTRDGTFGVTSRVAPFPHELVEALETHVFQSARVFQWRNAALDFSSVAALRASLDEPATEDGLTRALPADDQKALEHATKTPDVMALADTPARVERLWDVCQVPDYRKIAPANHADLILTLFQFLAREGAIPDDWIAGQVRYADRTDGDIDTLSNRIAHVRTWTFVANRNDWLADPAEWRETTRNIEDRLSDALHERLMQRFVDRRTSVLMKRLRENAMLESEVNDAGDVIVEGQHVGALHGFRFQADPSAGDPRDQKALRAAAAKALAKELEKRADKAASAPDSAFVLGSDAGVRWQGALIGKLTPTEDTLKPVVVLFADETLPPPARERVQGRLSQFVSAHIEGLLKPLFELRAASDLEAGARGLAYRISENLGSVGRTDVAEDAKALDQSARAGLRALGVRFGAYHIFVPALLKPAPSQLLALLWALKNADLEVSGLQEVPQLSASGRTSIPVNEDIPTALYAVVGFRVCGPRAVRIDILERLADQIRPLVAWRPGPQSGDPPPGAVPAGGAFLVTATMTSLLGCSGDDFNSVLTSLGYRVERREANEAERAAIGAAQQVRRSPSKKLVRPGRDIPERPTSEAATPAAAIAPAHDAEPAAPIAPEAASAPADAPASPDTSATDEASASAGAFPPAEEPVPPDAVTVLDAPAVAVAPDHGAELLAAAAPAQPAVQDLPSAVLTEANPADAQAPHDLSDASAPADPPTVAAPPDAPEPALLSTEPEAVAPDEAQTPTDAAPVLIEIWRVPRHQRGGDANRRRRVGQPAGDQPGNERRDQRRRSRKPQAAAGGDAPQAGTYAEGAVPASGASAAPDVGAAVPSGGPAQEERTDRTNARKGKKRNKQAAPRTDAPRPQRREREADPDSPFAALAALKRQLEKGSDDR